MNDLPMFFLEINPLLHLDQISSRVDADAQTRARFLALYNVTPTLGFMASVSWGKGLRLLHGQSHEPQLAAL
ncbi:hypothetical protein M378DRAFT_163447 [Amanita muscaria Koide BX008]|uniref:Uncharacterized protein n=1 Tax=Amanita muscaria (strain Koide BX008) TaxID=946122 RepID=A0A0C2TBT7_AMAMK|nr:hypothetical protein M378DRAFT_163447 [Amanita muscaria Koide BX008]